ncbi:MAG: aldo/keto reductase [Rhodobacteraceae bacterium]|nr:aldo/keto reductase [Paracoccaceae bacterium]
MSTDAHISQVRPQLADGTPVSHFCFGAMQFGSGADQTAARAMYDACRAAGINFFDTAHVYTDGLSETWLGSMVRDEREAVYVASKVSSNGPADRGTICAQMDESRRRLGLDCIDAVYLHRWDAHTPLDETFDTLAELRVAGAFRDLGVSNYAAWQVMKAAGVAAKFGLRITLLQPMYNLVKRQAEVELLPMAQDQGIAVAPYSPLGGGLLTGKYSAGGKGRLSSDPRYAVRYGQSWMYETAGALSQLAEEIGISATTLAVAWVAQAPAITAPIISARSLAQLEPSLAALEFAMDQELRDRITALSPTPAPATDRLEEA